MVKKHQITALFQFLKAKENRLGVVILAVGLIALIYMGTQAYIKFFGGGEGNSSLYTSADVPIAVPEYVQIDEKKKPQFSRELDIQKTEVEGSWDAQGIGGRALLQFKNGQYTFVFLYNEQAAINIYSIGTYELKNDLMILTPDRNTARGQKQFPDYRTLTRSRFPLAVTKKGRKLVLYKPDRSFDVYVPPRHAFLNLMPDEVGRFSVLK